MSELDLKRLQNGSDIRGIALAGVDGEEPNLTEDTASLLAHGFCAWLSEKTGKPFLSLTVSIGRDPRLSGKALQDAAINAMAAARRTRPRLRACFNPRNVYVHGIP